MLFSAHLGEGAFYDVVPYAAIVVPASLIGLYILAVLLVGGVRFWRASGGNLSELLDVRALTGVTWDVLRLRYL